MDTELIRPKWWKCLLALVGLIIMSFIAQPGKADDKYWVGPTGTDNLWSTSTNWNPENEPLDGDTVYLFSYDDDRKDVFYDTSSNPLLSEVRINADYGEMTLLQSSNVLSADYEYVGIDGFGAGFLQTGGSNMINNTLVLGEQGDSYGTYRLYDTGSPASLSATTEVIGNSGTGHFIQSGGTHTVTNTLTLAANPGSSGNYELEYGDLSVGSECIGLNGSGGFTQDGGIHTVNNDSVIGLGGEGVYIQWGDSYTVGKNLFLGKEVNGNGSFGLFGGFLYTTNEIIGNSGTGNLDQSTTSTNITKTLTLAANPGSSGTYVMYGGDLYATNEIIGNSGTGLFRHLEGFNSVNEWLILGYMSSGSGTYELIGTGKLDVTNELIGMGGPGTFTQSDGTHTVDNLVISTGLASGTYNLEGGTLIAGTIQVNPEGALNVTGVDSPLEITVTGNVTNAGTVKTTNATVTWDGTFTNIGGGEYHSDPCTNIFTDFVVEEKGCVMAAPGDTFVIKNDFTNQCTRHDEWDTGGALLQFLAGDGDPPDSHNLSLPSEDMGASWAGYENNYAWGKLILCELDSEGKPIPGTEQTVHLLDGNSSNSGTALYVGEILGLEFGSLLITNIYGHGLNIYYDPTLEGNAYLNSLTYDLMDGGELRPTPVPASVLLLGSGLLGLGLLGWRRKRSE